MHSLQCAWQLGGYRVKLQAPRKPMIQGIEGFHHIFSGTQGTSASLEVKIWNQSMGFRKGKPPLVTLHIPLLTLGAWEHGFFSDCQEVQDYLLRTRFQESCVEPWCVYTPIRSFSCSVRCLRGLSPEYRIRTC